MMEKNWCRDIKQYFEAGLWTPEMVQNAVRKGKLTAEQYQEITGEIYPA